MPRVNAFTRRDIEYYGQGADVSAMFKEFAERQAIVSTTPLGLAHGLQAYLSEYPHGCTEQITSRAFPWLVLKDDANFGLDQDEATRAIASTMNQLPQPR